MTYVTADFFRAGGMAVCW